jgi:hypothetical protein
MLIMTISFDELKEKMSNLAFTTTYENSAYHHWSCEFESHSGEVYPIQHYVIKFVSDLRKVGGLEHELY